MQTGFRGALEKCGCDGVDVVDRSKIVDNRRQFGGANGAMGSGSSSPFETLSQTIE
jgi:hypothetical protein